MNPFINILLAGLCVGSISFTVTFTAIFDWLRNWTEKTHPKLGDLFSCPWCFSHWTSFILLLVCPQLRLHINNSIVINYLFTAFCITAIAGLLHYVYLRAYEPIIKIKAYKQAEALKKEEHERRKKAAVL